MCLALPARVVELLEADMAIVAFDTVKKRVSLALVEGVQVGDYVLIHVGYALHKVSQEEAARTLEMMEEAGVLEEEMAEVTA